MVAEKSRQPKKAPVWLPYLQSVRESKKGVFEFVFNGGEETIPADQILSVMVYGDADTAIDTKVLDKLCRRGIPVVIHRRNVERSIFITIGPRADPDDTLSAHLIKRSSSRASTHMARRLLLAKMQSMTWLVEPKRLPPHASVDQLRNIEAVHAKAYWDAWFKRAGHPEWRRRSKNPAAETLDAVSKFCAGIVLRWITYHNLSPFHGFLHTPTDYPTLVYDLLEPYRGHLDFIVLKTILSVNDEKKWVPHSIAAVKAWLNSQTYVPLTRQIVTHQELFHGVVLSAKFYVLGKQKVFHIPMPGKANGGRPAKVEFKLYGRHAGKTDFWRQAEAVAERDIPITDPKRAEAALNTAAPPVTTAGVAPPTNRDDDVPPGDRPAAPAVTATGRMIKATPHLPPDYCVIDIETTGLVASNDKIIELAALRVRGRKIVDKYETLVRVDVPLNETIRELTGLTDEVIALHGISREEALAIYCDFIKDDLLVGHNVNFDIKFINQALYELQEPQLINKSLNTIPVARKLFPGRTSYRLRDLAADLGVTAAAKHRALGDCELTNGILEVLYPPDAPSS